MEKLAKIEGEMLNKCIKRSQTDRFSGIFWQMSPPGCERVRKPISLSKPKGHVPERALRRCQPAVCPGHFILVRKPISPTKPGGHIPERVLG